MDRPRTTITGGMTTSTHRRHKAVATHTGLTLAILAIVTAVASVGRSIGATQPIAGISLFILLGFAALFAILALTWSYTAWANRRDRLDLAAREVPQ